MCVGPPPLPHLFCSAFDLRDPSTVLGDVEKPAEPEQEVRFARDVGGLVRSCERAPKRFATPVRPHELAVRKEGVESRLSRDQLVAVASDCNGWALGGGPADDHGDELDVVDAGAADAREEHE